MFDYTRIEEKQTNYELVASNIIITKPQVTFQ